MRPLANKTLIVSFIADVLTTSASVEALLLSPSTNSTSQRMEAASSPMSPLHLTSVEINEVSDLVTNSEVDLQSLDVSPSRFSSNSINTVILNPNIVQNNYNNESDIQT